MLQGRYIKYSPEITFEVFQKIWNKLIDDGWKEFTNIDIQTVYNEFKLIKPVITYSNAIKSFSTYSEEVILEDNKELTLSEIFGKFLTSFPKEGCCKTNDPILINFLNKKYPFSNPTCPNHFSGAGWSSTGFWYLINVEKSSKPLYTLEELKPFIDTEEYVKVINDGKSYINHSDFKEFGCNSNKKYPSSGKVYKVIKITEKYNITFYALDYNGDHYLIDKAGTEPSTKEEYDNQFKTKVTGTITIDDDLRSSWIKDQENAILKGQILHEKFYTNCKIFPKINRYIFGTDPYEEMFNIKQNKTFPQPIFLKKDETVKVKQINQIKELKFLNIK